MPAIADIDKTELPPFEIKEEWIYINGKKTDWNWNKLVMAAYIKRVSLSEHAHYAPPDIHFDPAKEKGPSIYLSCIWNCYHHGNDRLSSRHL